MGSLVPHSHVADKNQGGYLGCKVPPEEEGDLVPSQAPQPRVPVPGKEFSITSGCKNQQEFRLREVEGP